MKITKTQLKQIIKEEISNVVKQTIRENNEPMEETVSHILAPYFVEYVKKDSFKQSGDDELTTYEFTMVIPKGEDVINGLSNAIDVEEYLEREFGTGSSSGRPGGMFTRTMYEVEQNYPYMRDLLVHVMHRVGYDV